MKPHERRDKILRIRAASLAWQEADRVFEALTGRRARMMEFLAEMKTIYSPELVEALVQLRARDPSGVDEGILFLEANPICFHSGYDKQRILRYLRQVPLTDEQEAALRGALLVGVREGAGVEFRDCCRTARIVDTPRFRRDLQEIRADAAASEDARQRAGWMLDALIRTNGPEPPPAHVTRAGPRSRQG